MLLTLSEAARLLERKRGKKVHWSTLRRWGQAGRFCLYFANGWKVQETEFTDWAARAGKLRKKSGGGRDIEARSAGALACPSDHAIQRTQGVHQ